MLRKPILAMLVAALAAAPAAAQRQFKLLNPTTWLNIGQQVVSNECGWIVGAPFTLEGRQTQLAIQVWSGNADKPAFLVSFDASDAREIELSGAPGMILHLRGGTYTSVQKPDGPRSYLANNREMGGWDVREKVRRAAECGVSKLLKRSGNGNFFDQHGYLVAGAALASYPDVFAAYFAGQPDEARKLLERARLVESAAARFLGEPSMADAASVAEPLPAAKPVSPVIEVLATPKGCDLELLIDLVTGLDTQIQSVEGSPTTAQTETIKAISAAANLQAAMCQ